MALFDAGSEIGIPRPYPNPLQPRNPADLARAPDGGGFIPPPSFPPNPLQPRNPADMVSPQPPVDQLLRLLTPFANGSGSAVDPKPPFPGTPDGGDGLFSRTPRADDRFYPMSQGQMTPGMPAGPFANLVGQKVLDRLMGLAGGGGYGAQVDMTQAISRLLEMLNRPVRGAA